MGLGIIRAAAAQAFLKLERISENMRKQRKEMMGNVRGRIKMRAA